MSRHLENPPYHLQNTNYDPPVVSLGYFADELGVSRQEARMIHSKMHSATWLDAPVLASSCGRLPEYEDGIHKLVMPDSDHWSETQ